MRVLGEVFDPSGVETAGPAIDAVHHAAFLQQELRQVAAILAGDARIRAVLAELVGEGGMETSRPRAGTTYLTAVTADGSRAQPFLL